MSGYGQAGRPDATAPSDVRLHIRLTAAELAHYRDQARRAGVSVSEWVRAQLSGGKHVTRGK